MFFCCGIDEEFLRTLVNEVCSVVSEDISLDLMRASLQRKYINSYPTRTWDLINDHLYHKFEYTQDIITKYSKRGPWNFIAIFHKPSGMLFTIMREERLAHIRKKMSINHYVAHLAYLFNHELQVNQQSFFPFEFNEHEVALSVDRICNDLTISKDMVKNHAIILFSSRNDIITSIRLVMVNCYLEECVSYSLNKFIVVKQSVVVDQIDKNDRTVSPVINLKYKEKAKRKQGTIHDIHLKEDDNIERNKVE